jgi:polysaccharide biosynthesis protein PslH
MKILQLCNKSPLPPKEGGPIAMYHLAQALMNGGHHVDVLTIVTPKYNPDKNEFESMLTDHYTYEKVFVNTDVTFSGAFIAFLRSKPYHIKRFVSDKFNNTLIHKLKNTNYDVVIFETLYMSPYLQTVKTYSDARCILRSHNIEHLIWERIAQHERSTLKRKYISYLAKTLKRYELNTLSQFDAIACISENEVQYYLSHISDVNVHLLPFGIELDESINVKHEGTGFYHLGSMDWMPNIEGIRWLMDNVVPILEEKAPSIRITLAGRNMPSWVYDYNSPVVEIAGEVDDAQKFVASKSVLLVPLLSGSGIRIKIIEAMALGKAVISTSIGAEGISFADHKNIMIADTPEQFADSILQLQNDKNKIFSLGEQARKLITENHNYNSVLNEFQSIFNEY